jgi:hypothetical protein
MSQFFVRDLDPEMGLAVAKRTYFRENENWKDVAIRVALGNSLLHPTGEDDRLAIQNAMGKGAFLSAGRHLQHGDITQPSKNLELFSNCSTACTSFLEFLLLLNGSGVGRNYSDDVMVVDWTNMPYLYCILSQDHPDYISKYVENENRCKIIRKEDIESYPENPDLYHLVEDSREGWAKALEILEVAAFQGRKYDHFVFDFSNVREKGVPIHGMQDRPASGPLPLIYAFTKCNEIKYMEDMDPWMQTMFIDHFFSECVVNGGARRSSRIGVKFWKDKGIFKFIRIKRDYPWLWSSNNSVGVDEEFWLDAEIPGTLANAIFLAVTESSFADAEPGLINLDKLTEKD